MPVAVPVSKFHAITSDCLEPESVIRDFYCFVKTQPGDVLYSALASGGPRITNALAALYPDRRATWARRLEHAGGEPGSIKSLIRLADKSYRPYLISASELKLLPDPCFLVEDMVEEGTISSWFGQAGAGKSTLTLDMAASIATGTPFLGHATQQRRVLYVAAEAWRGFSIRVHAWQEARATDIGQRLQFVTEPIDLFRGKLAAFFNEVAAFNPEFLVIDTLARCSSGADENEAKDMGSIIDSLDRIRGQLSATIVVVHHTGKDPSKHERGSTALAGSVDARVWVNRKGYQGVVVSCLKQRNAEPFSPIAVNFAECAGALVPVLGTTDSTSELAKTITAVVQTSGAKGMNTREIRAAVPNRAADVGVALAALIEDTGSGVRVNEKGREKRYFHDEAMEPRSNGCSDQPGSRKKH